MKKIIGLYEIEGAKIISFKLRTNELFLSTDKGMFWVKSDVEWIDHHCAESYISIPTTTSDDQLEDHPDLFFDDNDEYEEWKKDKEEREAKEQLESDKRQLEYAEKQLEQIKARIKKYEINT